MPRGGGVFAVAGAPETPKQRVLAKCLEVDGVATGSTSAALHGLDGFQLRDPVDVLVTHGRGATRMDAARLHRSRYLPREHVVEVDGIPTLNVARTLFSLAAQVPGIPEHRVSQAIEDALRKRLATEAWLRWMLDLLRRPGRNGVAAFERALDVACRLPVTESWLETESLRIIAKAGLPLPLVQQRIAAEGEFVARVDFQYAGTSAVIEANGHGSHSTPEQLSCDSARRRKLTAAGYQVYDFTSLELRDHPERLVETARAIVDGTIGRLRPS